MPIGFIVLFLALWLNGRVYEKCGMNHQSASAGDSDRSEVAAEAGPLLPCEEVQK